MSCAKFLPGSGSASGKPPPPPVIAASLGFKSTKVQQAWGSKVHSVKTLLPQEKFNVPKNFLTTEKKNPKNSKEGEGRCCVSPSVAVIL